MTKARIIRLFVSPRSLPEIALATSTPVAALVGSAVIGAEAAILLCTLGAGINAPFPDLNTYLLDHLRLLAYALPLGIFACGFSIGAVSMLAARVMPYRDQVVVRILLLAPASILPALLLWSVLTVFNVVNEPFFELLAGKPTWIDSPPIRTFGSWWWVPVLGAWLCWLYANSIARLVAMIARSCEKCGYDLRGNPLDGCPECGWWREADG